LGFS
jgi:hypothetical protein